MLKQLQNRLARGELLYYWHKKFNLLDETNSLQLLETSREMREIIQEIERKDEEDEDQYFLKMFYPDVDIEPEPDLISPAIFIVGIALLYRLYEMFASDPLKDQLSCDSNSTSINL